ncbi:hypothetical protein POM88_051866 [Heracleum sosnowskyi]|uniref:NADH:ubiquinone reductase (non-electrogenic) n=1 Tax=Heracleum sosnowskyi TaxID=360622 RepID=A0AAD8GSY9_9APIA|nr:hypothetical protein POM88_051866 [Heracleum sosnowskyi]
MFDIVQAFRVVEDSQRIHWTAIDCFERASLSIVSDKEREKILFFVVVDGGPTRVEFAAELHDFFHEDLAKLYPTLKPYVTITLLEAADHILGMLIGKCWQLMNGLDISFGQLASTLSSKACVSVVKGSEGDSEQHPCVPMIVEVAECCMLEGHGFSLGSKMFQTVMVEETLTQLLSLSGIVDTSYVTFCRASDNKGGNRLCWFMTWGIGFEVLKSEISSWYGRW